MRRRPIPWRPLRPSFALFWQKSYGRRLIKRKRLVVARRRIILTLPDPRLYPEHSPPPMKFERDDDMLHRVVLRGLFARRMRRPE